MLKKFAGKACAFAAVGVRFLDAALGDGAASVKGIAIGGNASGAIAFFAKVARFANQAAIGTDVDRHVFPSFFLKILLSNIMHYSILTWMIAT